MEQSPNRGPTLLSATIDDKVYAPYFSPPKQTLTCASPSNRHSRSSILRLELPGRQFLPPSCTYFASARRYHPSSCISSLIIVRRSGVHLSDRSSRPTERLILVFCFDRALTFSRTYDGFDLAPSILPTVLLLGKELSLGDWDYSGVKDTEEHNNRYDGNRSGYLSH